MPPRSSRRDECVWQRTLDVVVHLNALLPCAVVYWTLAVAESAWLAVVLYESICLVGVPMLTLAARGHAKSAVLVRLRPLVHSLVRPQEWRRCALVTTGSLCVFGFGGFATYLAACQREFDQTGVSAAIRYHSDETGLGVGSPAKLVALVLLGVWFCTVNPVLEELFWRGYVYAELGRMFKPRAEPFSEEKRDYGSSALLPTTDQSMLSRWLTSAYFASFHAVVVAVFVNWIAAAVTFAFLAITSRIWIWLAERPPFGFPFVVAFHAGADVAVVLVFSACDFGWAKHAAFVAALVASIVLTLIGGGLLAIAWRHEADCCLPRAADPDYYFADSPLHLLLSSPTTGRPAFLQPTAAGDSAAAAAAAAEIA
ncbi:hypothetical protein CTAYLR_010560 [Chrysophaeum taylorii]|uniref:CAAX prenyl protease 2/Lysostaphin resistance protein A-like domain-containing protein n=1 Tax=Chrysophaeum taylorii TaxID=2483200 RepID=A0AAD7UJA7_9STRA|nr:hypothetical protein CTAYLR_010560 [Chrysophaeum taylorii]